MSTTFSETLVRLRKTSGFQTAYRFFHDNGGAPVLKISYRNYLLIEQGRILPVIDRLMKLLIALRLPQNTPAAKELVIAWLNTMAGQETYDYLLAPLIKESKDPAPSASDNALQRAMTDKKYYMTEKQLLSTISSFEAYKCSFTLENDSGTWSAADLASALHIKTNTAEKALKDFSKVKLVKQVKKGVYRSQVAGRLVEYPDTPALRTDVRDKLREYMKRLEQEGRTEVSYVNIFRADSLELRNYFPMIKSTVETSHAYAATRKTKNTAGFVMIGRLLRLWNF